MSLEKIISQINSNSITEVKFDGDDSQMKAIAQALQRNSSVKSIYYYQQVIAEAANDGLAENIEHIKTHYQEAPKQAVAEMLQHYSLPDDILKHIFALVPEKWYEALQPLATDAKEMFENEPSENILGYMHDITTNPLI